MDSFSVTFFLSSSKLLLLFFFLSCCILFLGPANSAQDGYNSLVYTSCRDKPLPNPLDSYSQTLSSLLQDLISKSTQSKFYKTSSGNDQAEVSGRFQCRGNLRNTDCHQCVSAISDKAKSLCGQNMASRVQLSGCYMHYAYGNDRSEDDVHHEPDRFRHKRCEEDDEREAPEGLMEMVEAAFSKLEDDLYHSNDRRYYETDYRLIHVSAQCEEDLREEECRECVKKAAETAEEECRKSTRGEVYLDGCSLRYRYYPYGVPHESDKMEKMKDLKLRIVNDVQERFNCLFTEDGEGDRDDDHDGEGDGEDDEHDDGEFGGKNVAIVLGVVGALFFIIVFFMLLGRRRDY